MFETISDEDLCRASGGVASNNGVRMRLTQFGYPHDPDGDSETRKGHGAYSHLAGGRSIALTDSALSSLHLTKAMVRREHPWVDIHLKGGGVLTRRIDDRAPERNRRVDLYMPGGMNRRLPDYATVSLHGK